MSETAIAFPNLGIYLEYVPKNFTVFGYTIALYGCILALGVLGGMMMADWEARKTGQNPELYWDFALYAVVFSVIGARVYYVAFSWDYYKNNLKEIVNIRNGGGAIYGSVIAAFLTAFIYAKVKKVSFLTICDTGVMGLLVGQIIGRWGNFTNREVFGQYSEGLFAMRLPISMVRQMDISAEMMEHVTGSINYIQVQPTFLYESVWNLCVLVLLIILRKKRRFAGENALWYLGGYGLGRCIIEGMRTDQLKIGTTGLAVSQLLGGALFIFMVVVEVIYTIRKKKAA